MRTIAAVLTLLLAAPVLAAGALEAPDASAAPRAPGADDTCPGRLPAPLPPIPSAPCLDVPLLVDEGGDVMTGNLVFDDGAAISFDGWLLQGVTGTSLRYGSRAVCLGAVDQAGCGDIEGVSAGSGLSGGATSGTASLSVNTALIQSRVSAGCAAGSSIRGIDAAGAVTCETDDTGAYTGAAPISVGASTIGLSASGCTAGEAWLWSGSAWSCDDLATQAELAAVHLDLQAQLTTQAATLASHGSAISDHAKKLSGHTVRLDDHAGAIGSLATELATHQGSGDHDGRYALTGHNHGFASVEPTTAVSSGSGTAATLTLTVPDACPGAESHRYLVEASGQAVPTSFGGATVSAHLSIDDGTAGSSTRTVVLGEPFSTLRFPSLGTGSHIVKLKTQVTPHETFGASSVTFTTQMYALHLGWTCS